MTFVFARSCSGGDDLKTSADEKTGFRGRLRYTSLTLFGSSGKASQGRSRSRLVQDEKQQPKYDTCIGSRLRSEWARLARLPGLLACRRRSDRQALADHIDECMAKMFPPHYNMADQLSGYPSSISDQRSLKGFWEVCDACKTRTKDGNFVAVKVLMHASVPHRPLAEQLRVAWTWSQLSHGNIVPLLGLAKFSRVRCGASPQLGLISPWMDVGNVVDFVNHFPDKDRTDIILDIADAVRYLHGRYPAVIHGNMRGSNVLIQLGGDRPTAVLTDIGLSSLMSDGCGDAAVHSSRTQGGLSSRWLAPERLSANGGGLATASTASDVFELCRTILEILSGSAPFACALTSSFPSVCHSEDISDYAVTQVVLEGRHPMRPSNSRASGLTDVIWQVLLHGWASEPENRPSANSVYFLLLFECLSHRGSQASGDMSPTASSQLDITAPLTSLDDELPKDAVAPGFSTMRKHLDTPSFQRAVAKVVESGPKGPLYDRAFHLTMFASEPDAIDFEGRPFHGIARNFSCGYFVKALEYTPTRNQISGFELIWKIILEKMSDAAYGGLSAGKDIDAILPLIAHQLSRLIWTYPEGTAQDERLVHLCFDLLNLRLFGARVVANWMAFPSLDEEDGTNVTRMACRRLWELLKIHQFGDMWSQLICTVASGLSVSRLVRKVVYIHFPEVERKYALDDLAFLVEVVGHPSHTDAFRSLFTCCGTRELVSRYEVNGHAQIYASAHLQRVLKKLDLM